MYVLVSLCVWANLYVSMWTWVYSHVCERTGVSCMWACLCGSECVSCFPVHVLVSMSTCEWMHFHVCVLKLLLHECMYVCVLSGCVCVSMCMSIFMCKSVCEHVKCMAEGMCKWKSVSECLGTQVKVWARDLRSVWVSTFIMWKSVCVALLVCMQVRNVISDHATYSHSPHVHMWVSECICTPETKVWAPFCAWVDVWACLCVIK